MLLRKNESSLERKKERKKERKNSFIGSDTKFSYRMLNTINFM